MSETNSPENPALAGTMTGVRSTLAVGAGKGGVGKSTAAALLAIGLQRRGASVGLLDADVYGPSIPTLMNVADQRPEIDAEDKRIFPVEAKGVKLISIGLLVDANEAIVWRGPMVHGVVQQFLQQVEWGKLDYLIVDLPPGTGDVPLTLSQSIPMTGAVVISTPQDIALQDACRAVKMYRALKVPCLGIVENMSYYLCPECGHREEIFDCGGAQQAAGVLGVPYLGAIPLNAPLRRFCDAGTPENSLDPGEGNDQMAAALDTIVSNVIEQVEERHKAGDTSPTLSVE